MHMPNIPESQAGFARRNARTHYFHKVPNTKKSWDMWAIGQGIILYTFLQFDGRVPQSFSKSARAGEFCIHLPSISLWRSLKFRIRLDFFIYISLDDSPICIWIPYCNQWEARGHITCREIRFLKAFSPFPAKVCICCSLVRRMINFHFLIDGNVRNHWFPKGFEGFRETM